ncbi:putative translocon-associated protein, gamma subunit [Ixodes scapularis]
MSLPQKNKYSGVSPNLAQQSRGPHTIQHRGSNPVQVPRTEDYRLQAFLQRSPGSGLSGGGAHDMSKPLGSQPPPPGTTLYVQQPQGGAPPPGQQGPPPQQCAPPQGQQGPPQGPPQHLAGTLQQGMAFYSRQAQQVQQGPPQQPNPQAAPQQAPRVINVTDVSPVANMAGSKKLTKEEELLLQDFSRNVSTKSSALFYGNAFIVSAIPIWLFWRIHQMDLYQSAIVFAVMTLLCTWLIAFAYKSVKFVLKHKVAPKREDAVSREIMKKLSDDKKMSKKEKDERILWKKNEVADYEATTFSIFYNNALFLTLIIVTSFYILRAFSPMVNYVFSVGGAAGLLALFSTGSQ